LAKKDRKIAKKARKIAPLSLYYIGTIYEIPGGAVAKSQLSQEEGKEAV